MKLVCVDYGEKRIGLAATDTGGRMAFPRKVLAKSTRQRMWEEVLAFLAEEDPGAIVVGLPLHADGTDGLVARQVRNFTASLQRRSPLPVYFMPETLSSEDARSLLREGGKESRVAAVDHLAAARILESFLALPEEKRISA